MLREVFIVKNNTVGEIELKDFGLLIPSGVTVDLTDFDNAISSDELYNHIQLGNIVRVIDGVEITDINNAYDLSNRYYDSDTPYNNIINVSKSGSTFTTINSALDHITDNDSNNRYLINITPDLYEENVTMKPYVTIKGMSSYARIQGKVSFDFSGTTASSRLDNVEIRNFNDNTVYINTEGIAVLKDVNVKTYYTSVTGQTIKSVFDILDGIITIVGSSTITMYNTNSGTVQENIDAIYYVHGVGDLNLISFNTSHQIITYEQNNIISLVYNTNNNTDTQINVKDSYQYSYLYNANPYNKVIPIYNNGANNVATMNNATVEVFAPNNVTGVTIISAYSKNTPTISNINISNSSFRWEETISDESVYCAAAVNDKDKVENLNSYYQTSDDYIPIVYEVDGYDGTINYIISNSYGNQSNSGKLTVNSLIIGNQVGGQTEIYGIYNENDLGSNLSTGLATQSSIKAYVDNATSGSTAPTLQVVTDAGASTTNESTFSGGIVLSDIRPSSDSTTAIQINKTDGVTPVINIDTVSGLTGFGTETPKDMIHIYGTDITDDDALGLQKNSITLDGVAGADKSIAWAEDGEVNWLAQTYRNENSRFWYLYNQQADITPLVVSSNGKIGINNPSNIADYHALQIIGNGLSDININGVYDKEFISVFQIQIDSVGATDTFIWRVSYDLDKSFGDWSTPISCSSIPISLESGIEITFENINGHNNGDTWEFAGFSQLPSSNLSVYPSMFSEIQKTDDYTSGTVEYEDITSSVSASKIDITTPILVNGSTDGAIYFGATQSFTTIFFNFETFGSNITLITEYWTGSIWVDISIGNDFYKDGTNNFTTSGTIIWNLPTSGWDVAYLPDLVEDGYELYWLRIRSSSNPTTTPELINVSRSGNYNMSVYASSSDYRPSFYVNPLGSTNIGGGVITRKNKLQINTADFLDVAVGSGSLVEMDSIDPTAADLRIKLVSNDDLGTGIAFVKTRGGLTSTTSVLYGDELGHLWFRAKVGSTGATLNSIVSYYTGNGTTTSLLGDLVFNTNNGTVPIERVRINHNGFTSFGNLNGTALITINSGTTTYAPLKFTDGTLLSSPQEGAVEFDGTKWYGTISGDTRKTFAFAEDVGSYTLQTVTDNGDTTTNESTFSGGIVTSKIRPSSDSADAISINKSNGTSSIISIDTISGLTGFGTILPQNQIHLYGTDTNDEDALGLQKNGILLDGVTGADKQIQWAEDGEVRWLAETYRGEDAEFWYLWNQKSNSAPMTFSESGRIGINSPTNIVDYQPIKQTGILSGISTNNIFFNGLYNKNYISIYQIKIDDDVTIPNEYVWRRSTDDGNTYGDWSTPTGMTTSSSPFDSGIEISFIDVSGFTSGDTWEINTFPQLSLSTLSVIPHRINKLFYTQDYTIGEPVLLDLTTAANTTEPDRGITITSGNTDGAIFIGGYTKIEGLYIRIASGGVGITTVVEYWNGSSWTDITVGSDFFLDKTNNFQNSGYITWNVLSMTNWTLHDLNSSGEEFYWIRITTSSSPSTPAYIDGVSRGSQERFSVYASPLDTKSSFYVDAEGRTSIGGGTITGKNLLQVGNIRSTQYIQGLDGQVEFDTEDSSASLFRMKLASDDNKSYRIGFSKYRGTMLEGTSIENGDAVGGLGWGAIYDSPTKGTLLADLNVVYTGTFTTPRADFVFSLQDGIAGDFVRTEVVRMTGLGNTSFGGIEEPTAKIHINSGTTSVAPLKFTSGTSLTTPEVGAVEFDGNAWYGTITGDTRQTFAFLESPQFTGTPELPIGTTLDSDNLYDLISNSGGTDNTSLVKTTDFDTYTGTTETRLQGIETDITDVSDETDLKLYISDFDIYTGTTTPWDMVDKTGSDLADLETKNASDVDYTNNDWTLTDTGGALDDITEYLDETHGSGRITPEIVLSGRLTQSLIVSGGTGYINYDGYHKKITWSPQIINVSGYTEGTYHYYVDTNSQIQVSETLPDGVHNIRLGFIYYGGSVIGVITQCGCIIDSSINRIADALLRQGNFIWDNGGSVELLSGSTLKIVSGPMNVQFGLLSTPQTEVSSDDASTFRFSNMYLTSDKDWEINYYFSVAGGGIIPTSRWNDTTKGHSYPTGHTLVFTQGSDIVTSTSNLTGIVTTSDFIHKDSDGDTYMNPVTGVTWTGSQTNIALRTIYLGAGGSGTDAVLDQSLPQIPVSGWTKSLIARDTDDNMYFVMSQQYYGSEDDAIAGTLPGLPSSIADSAIKMAYIVTQKGETDLTDKIYDIRPLPFQDREGGQTGGGATITNHGDLSGLANDDHLQYLLTNGTRNITGIQRYNSHPTFTNDLDVIDKKYSDDTKLTITNFDIFTGTTLPTNYYNKTEIDTYTDTTAPATYLNKTTGGIVTGDVNITQSLFVTGTTESAGVIAGTSIAVLSTSGKLINSEKSINSISNEVFDITSSQTITDLFGVLYVDTTSGDITITVPDASVSNDGSKIVILNNTGNNSVIVTTVGGTQLIGSSTTATIADSDKGITIISDSGNSKWLNVQDTTIVSKGTTNGELQYWDSTANGWKGSSTDLVWDNTGKDLSVSGNIEGQTISENSVSLVNKYLGITDFNTYSGNTLTSLDLKSNLLSPTFTGTPLSTTAAANTSTTQIATTAFVVGQAGTSNPLMDGTVAIGTSLRYARQDHVHASDTSKENNITVGTTLQYWRGDKTFQTLNTTVVTEGINLYFTNTRAQSAMTGAISTVTTSNLTINRAVISNASGKVAVSTTTSTELGYVAGVTSAIQTQMNLKSPSLSPTFTGTPLSTTAVVNTSSTQIATTAYVVGQAATSNPIMDSTVSIGTSLRYARQDHVHASDTSKLDITSFNTYTGTTLLVKDTRKFFAGKSSNTILGTTQDTIPAWDVADSLTDTGYFSWGNLLGEVTILKEGYYDVVFDCTILDTAGSNRSEARTLLQENTGSGFVDIPYTRKEYYNRQSNYGASGSVNILRYFNVGDKIRTTAWRTQGSDTLEVIGDGTSLKIVKSEVGFSTITNNYTVTGATGIIVTKEEYDIYTGSTQDEIEALGVSNSLYAFAKTTSGGILSDSFRLTVNRSAVGTYDYTFSQPVGTLFYGVHVQPFLTIDDTNAMVSNITLNGFTVTTGVGDNGGTPDTLTDTEHSVGVFGVPISGDTVVNVVSSSTFTNYTDVTAPSTYAPLVSPALSGVPTSTTASVNTSTTQIATTAFVVGQAGTTSPLIDGTATVGTSLRYARDDHRHPTDTTRQSTITGAATTITSSNLTTNRALLSDGSGKVVVSTVTNTELGYVANVTSAIQTQLNSKQATITGAATTITSSNLTASRVMVSDATGKASISTVTSAQLTTLAANVYGTQYQLSSSLTSSSSTSTTPVTKVTMTTTSLPAGTYRVSADWLFQYTSQSQYSFFDVTINGTTQGTRQPKIENKDGDNFEPQHVVYYVTLTAGIKTILLRYWGEGNTLTISDATIELIRVS